MKIFHISDLHIGKQLNTNNIRDIQEDIFNQIINKIELIKPDCLVVAGDIYDKSVPSGEAFTLFDDFLYSMNKVNPDVPVLIIAGNHDDASKLNFGSSFFKNHNIYISTLPPQNESEFLQKVVIKDVNFYLLPFTKPAMVRKWMDVESDYNLVIQKLIERENIDYSKINVLISHQFFVSGSKTPDRSDSEFNHSSVGGIDAVDIKHVENFDYVALGHIHGPQSVGKDHIRYSGTPIKYSLSEIKHEKGIQVIDIHEKGNIEYSFIKLESNPNIRLIRGTLSEILMDEGNSDDYVYIEMLDDPYNPLEQLREKFTHIVEVNKVNKNSNIDFIDLDENSGEIDPFESFRDFYKQMRDKDLSEEGMSLFQEILSEVSK